MCNQHKFKPNTLLDKSNFENSNTFINFSPRVSQTQTPEQSSSNNAQKSPALLPAHKQNYSIYQSQPQTQQAQNSPKLFFPGLLFPFFHLPLDQRNGINCLSQSHWLELCRTGWHQGGNCHCSFSEGEMWKVVNVLPGFSCCTSLLRNVTATFWGSFWCVDKLLTKCHIHF